MSNFIVNPYRFGAGFSPADVSGLILWLDASEGITKDGSNLVSAWADQSGSGNNLSAGGNKPTWTDSELNGLPAVVFGSDTSLAKATWSGGAISQPFYVFAVMTFGQSPEEYNWDGGGSSDRFYFYNDTDSRIVSCGTELTISGNPANNYYYVTFFVDGVSSNQRRNGVSQNSGNMGSGSWNGITLASRYSDESYNDPKFCEFLVYDNDVGTSNRDEIETYLAEKYDL